MIKKVLPITLFFSLIYASEGATAHLPTAVSGVAAPYHAEKENGKSYASLSKMIAEQRYDSAHKLLSYILDNILDPALEQDPRWLKSIKKEIRQNLELISALRDVNADHVKLFEKLIKVEIAFHGCLPDSVILSITAKTFPKPLKNLLTQLKLDKRLFERAGTEEMKTISPSKRRSAAIEQKTAVVVELERVYDELKEGRSPFVDVVKSVPVNEGKTVRVVRRLSFSESELPAEHVEDGAVTAETVSAEKDPTGEVLSVLTSVEPAQTRETELGAHIKDESENLLIEDGGTSVLAESDKSVLTESDRKEEKELSAIGEVSDEAAQNQEANNRNSIPDTSSKSYLTMPRLAFGSLVVAAIGFVGKKFIAHKRSDRS